MGVGGQRHTPAALLPEKTRNPLYRRLDGTHGLSGRVRKISPPPGFDPRTIQPVRSKGKKINNTKNKNKNNHFSLRLITSVLESKQ
jgi:hypothetical protein